MGWLSRLASWRSKSTDAAADALLWQENLWSIPSVTGISINQQTALNATAVMACVTMLAEDVAKLPANIYRRRPDGSREAVKDHFLYTLLEEPNDWQNWLEFCEQMQCGLILRGNAYAVILRNGRGVPVRLVPINPDRVALWQGVDGALFYKVTPSGFHEMAILRDQPFMIPAEDMFHIRGFSLNGLLGASRIMLAREAIGLGLAQEQQAARWMGQGAKPSGVLTTDQKLTPEAAKRISDDWKAMLGGLQNSGKTAVLEQGLKWQQLSMTSSDLEFIASRQFQLQEIARIFRVPPHMIGELSRSTNNNITQQSQEYVNYTLTGFTRRWQAKLSSTFQLRRNDLFVDFDFGVLTRADITARYNAYRTGIMSMFLTPNEARLDDGRDPKEGGDKLYQPQNMAEAGSQSTGTAPDDAGRPPNDQPKI
jgi:HK97 family phage portal protein